MEHQYQYQYSYHHYNLYSVLRLPCYTSNEAEIGKAFLKQSQLYHPNRNSDPGSQAWFQAIEHAYDVLKDSKSRAEYDQFLASSTQYEFSRASQAAKQHSSYLSWMPWDRKPETQSYWTSSSSKTSAAEDNSLINHIQALEREVYTLKASNSKIWAQASFHLAKTDCLLREKTNLQKQLDANQEAFHSRERGYVSRIRFLESTVASLRRSLDEHSNEADGEEVQASLESKNPSVAKGPTLIVELDSQPNGGSKSDNAVEDDDKTPTSSNLTQVSGKDPAQKSSGLVLKAHDDEKPKQILGKRPYSMPSLVDKENLDDACKINVKRIIPASELNRLPDAKKKKQRTAFGVVAVGTNCCTL